MAEVVSGSAKGEWVAKATDLAAIAAGVITAAMAVRVL